MPILLGSPLFTSVLWASGSPHVRMGIRRRSPRSAGCSLLRLRRWGLSNAKGTQKGAQSRKGKHSTFKVGHRMKQIVNSIDQTSPACCMSYHSSQLSSLRVHGLDNLWAHELPVPSLACPCPHFGVVASWPPKAKCR